MAESATMTTKYTYYTSPTVGTTVNDGAAFGKVKQETRPDGGWTHFVYDTASGAVTKVIENFLDNTYEDGENANRVVSHTIQPIRDVDLHAGPVEPVQPADGAADV